MLTLAVTQIKYLYTPNAKRLLVSTGVRLQRSGGTVREKERGGQATGVRHRQHQLPEQMRLATSSVL